METEVLIQIISNTFLQSFNSKFYEFHFYQRIPHLNFWRDHLLFLNLSVQLFLFINYISIKYELLTVTYCRIIKNIPSLRRTSLMTCQAEIWKCFWLKVVALLKALYFVFLDVRYTIYLKIILCLLMSIRNNQHIIKVFHQWTKRGMDNICFSTLKGISFCGQNQNFNTSEKEQVWYAGICTAISYVKCDSEKKAVPVAYWEFLRFVMLSGFDLQQNYSAIPQDFSKIQNLTEFGYFLEGHN